MAGALFAVFIVAIGLVLMVLAGPIFLLVPLVVLIVTGIFWGPAILASIGGRGGGGVPSTGDASYDPVANPSDQPAPR